jgi:hypothetical protein
MVCTQKDTEGFVKTYTKNLSSNDQAAANADGRLTTIYGKSGELFKDFIGLWLELA